MKGILYAALILSFAVSAFAQSTAAAAPSSSTTASSTASSATPSAKPDLASILTDAESAVSATNTDLANLHTEKWASGWKTGWTKKGSQKQQATQTAESIKAQAGALPEMIVEVRTAHGNLGSAFKLFNNLAIVCEELDSLAGATQSYGRKEEYTRLSTDYANLLKIRANLSAYIEQRAAVVDPRGNMNAAAAASKKDEPVKKTVAKKKPAKKVAAVN